MLEQQYKFYLSFENSICRDYVTGATKLKSCFYQESLSSPCNSEKFYNALLFNVVPVVYGGANYNAVAPKGSYIDVRDFTSGKYYIYIHLNLTHLTTGTCFASSSASCRVPEILG